VTLGPQKLLDNALKHLQELRNVTKGPSESKAMNLSPEAILERMEELKKRHDEELDPELRARVVTRMQTLHTSYQQLVSDKSSTAPQGGLAAQLQAEVDGHRKALEALSATEATQKEEFERWQSRLSASQPQIEALRAERKQCIDVVSTLRSKITEINEQYQQQWDNYKEARREWNAEMDVVMKARCAHRPAASMGTSRRA
jgi:uncharacterized coiled-coil DUF342 family protein